MRSHQTATAPARRDPFVVMRLSRRAERVTSIAARLTIDEGAVR